MLFQLRDLSLTAMANKGARSLQESILVPEVSAALEDWKKGLLEFDAESEVLVIGGVAYSYYSRPRTTTDIDVLVLSEHEVPPDRISGFKKKTPHRFQHEQTHVLIEVITPQFVGVSPGLFRLVKKTSVILEAGVRVPSIDGLIALKICRFSRQDKADVEALLNLSTSFTVDDWPGLSSTKKSEFLKEFPDRSN